MSRKLSFPALLIIIGASMILTVGVMSGLKGQGLVNTEAPGKNQNPRLVGSLDYAELQTALNRPKLLRKVKIDPSSGKVALTYRQGGRRARGVLLPEQAERYARRLSRAKVEVELAPSGTSSSGSGFKGWLLSIVVMTALMSVALFVFFRLRRRMGGSGGMLPSANIAKDNRAAAPATTFRDVAGCEEAVEEVSEFVQFLRNPQRFFSLGAKMPSGVLLHGPPGTGKTLLAKAVAGEAGVPFFSVSGSDFVEALVGMGASRVRNIFAKARACEDGAIIFIDEIDAVGKKRSSGGIGGGNDERDQTLNQLLVELDGFTARNRVVVFAATNRKDTLDEALLRPGRLSRHVRVSLPDYEGRLQILKVHARGKAIDNGVDMEQLARITAGSSGADLAEMLNEAAILAARENCDRIHQSHLQEGHLRALAGPEKKRSSLTTDEREMVAYHEAGHVLAAELCSEHEKAQRATIKPRGQAGGMAIYGQEDRALHSAQYLHEKLICALAGRAAEWVQYGKVSSGAANDLQQANAIARTAVEQLGFSPRAGQMISDPSRGTQTSDATKEVFDTEVERMTAEAYHEAVRLLQEHKQALDSLAAALLDKGDLDRTAIVAAVEQGGVASGVVAARPVQDSAPLTVPVLHQAPEDEPAALPTIQADAEPVPRARSLAAWWQSRPRRRRTARPQKI